MGTMKALTPEEHKILKEDFWDKNKRLTRPMSPHLGIYKVIYQKHLIVQNIRKFFKLKLLSFILLLRY